ncbi:MAG: prolyl oligopeptidase family serine peptidase [Puniceicoccaceae bacterium]
MKASILFALTLLSSISFASEIPPVADYFQNPTFDRFQLSPDGKYVAALAPYDGFMNVVVVDLETRTPRVLTGQKLDVTNFYWVSSDRIFYSMNQGESTNANMRNTGSIFGVSVDGSNHKVMVESAIERNRQWGGISGAVSFLHRLPSRDREVLVTRNDRRSNYPDLYYMDIDSGRLRKFMNNPGYVASYFVDAKSGRISGGLWWQDMNDVSAAVYRVEYEDEKDEKGEWVKLLDIPSIYEAPELVGTSADGKTFYVSQNDERGYASLFGISLETGEISEEPILSDETYDISVSRTFLDPRTKRVVGVGYEREKPVNHYFDPHFAALAKMIDDAIPDGFNSVVGADEFGQKLLIRSFSDLKSPEYFLLNLGTSSMEALGQVFPNLKNVPLATQTPIHYTSRDGRTIHGYLYFPEGYQKGEAVPLIVNPHGGPWARDTWGIRWWYDIEPSYLTSRGFAVLKVNFRSSTGYGDDHYRSSFKAWDAIMNDIYDGVEWAIQEGYAQPENVGIMGASFGGYATMTAVVKRPDLFRFGVNFFGVVDIPEHIRTYYQWDRPLAGDAWKKQVGDPDKPEELAKLEDWSAIHSLESLKAPLFIYHGLADYLVDIEQSRMLVGKLKSIGKKEGVDFVVEFDTNEGHGAYNAVKRIELYEKLDSFLRPFAPVYQN